jgi:hypothetical protein
MVDELAAALRRDADATCLAQQRIAVDRLRAHGEEILIRHGQARLDRTMTFFDAAKADAAFVRIGGPAAQAEWRALLADPVVSEYGRLGRAAKLVAVVDGTTENFDRVVLLSGLKLASIGTLTTGRAHLLGQRARAAGESNRAVEAFAARNRTPAMRRYLEMSRWVEQALADAFDSDGAIRYGPREWMPGLEADLRALCVGTR